MFNFVFLSVKRWFQFNSRIVSKHFASIMTEKLRNDCRNTKLQFQMKFSLSSTSYLRKLPINYCTTLCRKVSFPGKMLFLVAGEMKNFVIKQTDVLRVKLEASASLSLHGENHLTLINL